LELETAVVEKDQFRKRLEDASRENNTLYTELEVAQKAYADAAAAYNRLMAANSNSSTLVLQSSALRRITSRSSSFSRDAHAVSMYNVVCACIAPPC
jgi:hypothetical protein